MSSLCLYRNYPDKDPVSIALTKGITVQETLKYARVPSDHGIVVRDKVTRRLKWLKDSADLSKEHFDSSCTLIALPKTMISTIILPSGEVAARELSMTCPVEDVTRDLCETLGIWPPGVWGMYRSVSDGQMLLSPEISLGEQCPTTSQYFLRQCVFSPEVTYEIATPLQLYVAQYRMMFSNRLFFPDPADRRILTSYEWFSRSSDLSKYRFRGSTKDCIDEFKVLTKMRGFGALNFQVRVHISEDGQKASNQAVRTLVITHSSVSLVSLKNSQTIIRPFETVYSVASLGPYVRLTFDRLGRSAWFIMSSRDVEILALFRMQMGAIKIGKRIESDLTNVKVVSLAKVPYLPTLQHLPKDSRDKDYSVQCSTRRIAEAYKTIRSYPTNSIEEDVARARASLSAAADSLIGLEPGYYGRDMIDAVISEAHKIIRRSNPNTTYTEANNPIDQFARLVSEHSSYGEDNDHLNWLRTYVQAEAVVTKRPTSFRKVDSGIVPASKSKVEIKSELLDKLLTLESLYSEKDATGDDKKIKSFLSEMNQELPNLMTSASEAGIRTDLLFDAIAVATGDTSTATLRIAGIVDKLADTPALRDKVSTVRKVTPVQIPAQTPVQTPVQVPEQTPEQTLVQIPETVERKVSVNNQQTKPENMGVPLPDFSHIPSMIMSGQPSPITINNNTQPASSPIINIHVDLSSLGKKIKKTLNDDSDEEITPKKKERISSPLNPQTPEVTKKILDKTPATQTKFVEYDAMSLEELLTETEIVLDELERAADSRDKALVLQKKATIEEINDALLIVSKSTPYDKECADLSIALTDLYESKSMLPKGIRSLTEDPHERVQKILKMIRQKKNKKRTSLLDDYVKQISSPADNMRIKTPVIKGQCPSASFGVLKGPVLENDLDKAMESLNAAYKRADKQTTEFLSASP